MSHNNIRIVTFALFILVIVMTLVSCGSKDEHPDRDILDDQPLSIGGEITWTTGPLLEEEQVKCDAFIEAFTKEYPGVTVKYDYQTISCRTGDDIYIFKDASKHRFHEEIY